MDSIRFILLKIIRLVIIIFLIVFVMWLVNIIYPDFRLSQLFSTKIFNTDWLPAPKQYGLAGKNINKDSYGNVYQTGPAFNGYNNVATSTEYIAYSNNTTQTTAWQVFAGSVTYQIPERAMYLRNMSLYEGMPVSYGTAIYGEAKETMFRDGRFTVLVIDANGRIVGSANATASGSWATPGWHRFKVVIPQKLPENTSCLLLFISSNEPVRIGTKVQCQ